MQAGQAVIKRDFHTNIVAVGMYALVIIKTTAIASVLDHCAACFASLQQVQTEKDSRARRVRIAAPLCSSHTDGKHGDRKASLTAL